MYFYSFFYVSRKYVYFNKRCCQIFIQFIYEWEGSMGSNNIILSPPPLEKIFFVIFVSFPQKILSYSYLYGKFIVSLWDTFYFLIEFTLRFNYRE